MLSQIEQVPDKANLFKPKDPTKHLQQRPKHAIEPRAWILQSSAKSARYLISGPNHAIEQQPGSNNFLQFFGVCAKHFITHIVLPGSFNPNAKELEDQSITLLRSSSHTLTRIGAFEERSRLINMPEDGPLNIYGAQWMAPSILR